MDEKLQKDFINYFVGKKAGSLSSARTYINHLSNFEKRTGKALDEVKNDDIVNYLADLKLKLYKSQNTRRLSRSALVSFYEYYSGKAGIKNPAVDLEKIKEGISDPKLIHPDELDRMLHHANLIGGDRGRRACAVLVFLASTGVRIEEMEKMKFGDVRLVTNPHTKEKQFEVTVPALKTTYSRTVPFLNMDEDSIGQYFARYFIWLLIEKEHKPNNPLFYSIGSKYFKTEDDPTKPLLRGGVQYLINKAAYKAGIDRGITPHQFRHFYGTYATINGMHIMDLKELMGHANVTTTQRYIHTAHRIEGKILKHSPVSKMIVPNHMRGYSEILEELS